MGNTALFQFICTDCSIMWLKTDAYPMKTSAFSTTATVDSPIQKGTRLRANMHALQQHRSKNSFFIPPSLLPLPSSHLTLSQTDPLDRHSLTLTQAHWEQSKWPKLVSAVKSHRGISFAKELESNSPMSREATWEKRYWGVFPSRAEVCVLFNRICFYYFSNL